MSKRSSRKARGLPPLLVYVIEAAQQARDDTAHGDISHISDVPAALLEFGALARWAVPVHGVFVSRELDIDMAIERIAEAHFGGDEARHALAEALLRVEAFHDREALAAAINGVRTADSDTYFYAGLAFGITVASAPRGA